MAKAKKTKKCKGGVPVDVVFFYQQINVVFPQVNCFNLIKKYIIPVKNQSHS